MAVDGQRLAKLLNMLAADDMTALVAVRKIRDMAAAEKKLVSEICMTGPTRVIEKIVYREREAPKRNPEEEFRRAAEAAANAFRQGQGFRSGFTEEKRKREEEARKRRQERYQGAFDDAEMDDAARARARYKKPRGNGFKGTRALLDELAWALENNDDDLTYWEIDFAQNVPNQYSYDWELTANQVDVAERIIRKVKRNQGESPI